MRTEWAAAEWIKAFFCEFYFFSNTFWNLNNQPKIGVFDE